jgi:hypothetical protein
MSIDSVCAALAALAIAAGVAAGQDQAVSPSPASAVEPTIVIDLFDNGDFSMESAVTPVPFWAVTDGKPRVVDKLGARWLYTQGRDVVQQTIATLPAYATRVHVTGRVFGFGTLTIVDGNGAVAAQELFGTETDPTDFDAPFTHLALAIEDPAPPFLVQLSASERDGLPGKAWWTGLKAMVELPCPEPEVLRAEVERALVAHVLETLEHGRAPGEARLASVAHVAPLALAAWTVVRDERLVPVLESRLDALESLPALVAYDNRRGEWGAEGEFRPHALGHLVASTHLTYLTGLASDGPERLRESARALVLRAARICLQGPPQPEAPRPATGPSADRLPEVPNWPEGFSWPELVHTLQAMSRLAQDEASRLALLRMADRVRAHVAGRLDADAGSLRGSLDATSDDEALTLAHSFRAAEVQPPLELVGMVRRRFTRSQTSGAFWSDDTESRPGGFPVLLLELLGELAATGGGPTPAQARGMWTAVFRSTEAGLVGAEDARSSDAHQRAAVPGQRLVDPLIAYCEALSAMRSAIAP